MQATVVFDLGTVLSITTGTLLTDMGNVYKILNYMSGDDLFTHQLPRVSREMAPIILDQHPKLREINSVENVNSENWKTFLDSMIEKYGNEFPIIPCGLWEHKIIDPQEELEQMLEGRQDKIIIIDPNSLNMEDR